MQITPAIEQFWQTYLSTLAHDVPHPREYTAWYFGHTPQDAQELAELVLAGVKTATASLVWSFAAVGEAVPRPRDDSVITDFDGRPLGIIETTRVLQMPFHSVDPEHAFLEGEGDRSLAYWRAAHWRYFSEECRSLGRAPSEDMPVVCERFRLLYPTPGAAR